MFASSLNNMDFVIKPVTRRLKEYESICRMMKASFPKEELIPLTFWRMLTLRKGIDFSAVYADEKLVGAVYTVEHGEYLYVPFLVVSEGERNKGYGGRILQWLKEHYRKNIVLHIEPLDENAENYEQRLKRAEFYHRNEIDDTGYRFRFFGVPFAVYASDRDNFDVQKHIKLMQWFSFHIVRFDFRKEQ